MCARLSHPNILPLLDSGTVDGLPYYVTPFVRGASLRDRLSSEEPLATADAIRISTEVAEALAYAHREGVVHRDIKPANILLSSGHAVVADFGIAQAVALASGESLTRTGLIVGTVKYMSPEQASEDGHLDGRSDVYSLACVTYEMLTGAPPFSGRNPQVVLARQLHEEPPPIRVARPDVPVSVEAAIAKALSLAPEDRFATAIDFSRALRADKALAASWRRGRILAGAAVVVSLGLAAAWGSNMIGPPPLDASAVVVYPLVDDAVTAGLGEGLAGLIGYVMDDTEPLRWIEGWHLLDAEGRESVRQVSLEDAGARARAAGAGHFVTGRIVSNAVETTVILNLHDTRDGAVVERVGSTATSEEDVVRKALSSVAMLLLPLLEPGQTVEPGLLIENDPAALVNFYLGEAAYRRGAFEDALDFYFRAVGQDMTLALAAMRGAETAIWLKRLPEALAAADLAVQLPEAIPAPYEPLVEGMLSLLEGDADGAVASLLRHVDVRPRSASGWSILGEAYLHHFPTHPDLDGAAVDAFERALEADSDFVPATYHLIELYAMNGEVERATELRGRVDVALAPALRAHVGAVVACAEASDGSTAGPYLDALDASDLLSFGFVTAASSPHRVCSAMALERLVADSTTEDRYFALETLSSLLTGQGRVHEAHRVVEAAAVWSRDAPYLHLLIDITQDEASAEGVRVAASMRSDGDGESRPSLLWLSGVWETWLGQAEVARLRRDRLAELAHEGSGPAALLVEALDAQLEARNGSRTRAIEKLAALRLDAPVQDLQWRFWLALIPERLLLVELLLDEARVAEAGEVLANIPVGYPRTVVSAAFTPKIDRLRSELVQSGS